MTLEEAREAKIKAKQKNDIEDGAPKDDNDLQKKLDEGQVMNKIAKSWKIYQKCNALLHKYTRSVL